MWYSWFGSVAFAADGTCKFAQTGADGTWEVIKNTFDSTKGEFALKIVRKAFPVVCGSGDAKIQEPAEMSPFFLIEGKLILMNKPEFIFSKDADGYKKTAHCAGCEANLKAGFDACACGEMECCASPAECECVCHKKKASGGAQ